MSRTRTTEADTSTSEFTLYLNDISRFDLLSREQELHFARTHNHEQLINHNLRLVVSIARGYVQFCSVPIMDLIQEGNIGLIKAAQKYNLEKINPKNGFPYKFSTYATWWIKQGIARYINEHGHSIRIPSYIAEKARRVKRAGTPLEELDEEMRHILHILESFASLDAKFDDGDGLTLGELLEDKALDSAVDELSKREIADAIDEALGVLNERSQKIMQMRYGLGVHEKSTLEEIGREVCLTKERVRQIEYQGLKVLSHNHELAAL